MAFLLNSQSAVDNTSREINSTVQCYPKSLTKDPAFLQLPAISSTHQYNYPPLASFQTAKMSQYGFYDNINSFNSSNSFNNVWNHCTFVDDRSQILTWLSPLEPRLRHKDIQGSRDKDIGEWVLQTKEFKSWYTGSGGSESNNAVLFCHGGPGVGKTFIR